MDTSSVWQSRANEVRFSSASGDMEADVAIIGGGITGITAAMLLSQAGKSVVVLEALRVGRGTTGFSTGNLYATVDESLARIRETWSSEVAAMVVRSRIAAMELIEHAVRRYSIGCAFTRCAQYLYPTDNHQAKQMDKELEVLQVCGLPVSVVHDVPLPFPVSHALKIENQAQFNPLDYVCGLAQAISSDSCRIFEHSKVTHVDGDNHTLTTATGTLRANAIVMATHTPKGFNLVQTELGPYREYGIAAQLADQAYPEGIFWSLEEPGHSIRSYDSDGKRYLVVIGEKHKTGQPKPDTDYFQRVEEFARTHFNIASFDYRWSAQHYRPADTLPYIGLSAGSDNVYLATGFGTNGLVYGSLAAMIITSAIMGQDNPWKEMYSPTRFTPTKSAANFVKENTNFAGEYVRDHLTPAEAEGIAAIERGEGKLAQIGSEKLAVYRAEDGSVVVLSPVCPHLGCLVHWNGMEQSWDCPCHGSRFSPDGEVLEGPAIDSLKRKSVRDS